MLQRSLATLALDRLYRVDRAVTSRPTVEISFDQGSNSQKCHLRSTCRQCHVECQRC